MASMSPQRSRVAVVMRTKDRPVLLRRALADVAAQTFEDWRLVVVNDVGDPAPVDALVAQLDAGVRERVEVLHRTSSTGMESASNAGLAASDSEFVVVHDDDDTWEPTFLERTVAHLDAHPEEAGVVTRVEIVEERIDGDDVVELGRREFWNHLSAISLSDLLRTNRFVPIQLLYRRSVHDEVGPFDEQLRVVGDWDFHLRLAARHRIGLIDEVLAFWHQRPDQEGALGNSVIAAEREHDAADLRLRDDALRAHVAEHGMGDLLYLTRYLQGEFDHLHHRITHVERRLDDVERAAREAQEAAKQAGFTAMVRRKYYDVRARTQR